MEPEMFDKAMLKTIAGKIINDLYPPNECVVYAGGKSSEMYIIENGFCELISPGTKRVEKIIGPTSSFCVIDMFLGLPNLYTARTLTNVSLLRVPLNDMYETISQNQRFKKNIEEWSDKTRSSFPVQRLFVNTIDIIEEQVKDWAFQESFFYFPKGKLHPLNLDFQRGWSGFNLVKYFLRRRTIMPAGKFIYIYVIFHAVVAFLSCIINPMLFIFECIFPSAYGTAMIIPLDILNMLDIYIRMHVGYYNQDGVLITHPRLTATHYLSHSFAIDLIGSLPIGMIHYFFMHNKNGCYLMFIKLIKAYRIPNGFAICNKDVLKRETVLVNVFKYLLLTILALNAITCLMVLISCSFTEGDHGFMSLKPYPNSWIYTKVNSEITMDPGEFAPPFQIYLLGVYFTSLMTNQLGYGDVFVVKNYEVLTTAVAIIAGYLWFTYILVIISNTKAIMNENLAKYQNYMRDLIIYFKEHKTPKPVVEKSIRHFEYLWQRTHGTNANDIFGTFHLNLKGDCVLNIYLKTLSSIAILKDADIYLYRSLGLAIREDFFLEDNEVIPLNNILDSVYILNRGEVNIHGPAGSILTTLHRGAIFGNLDQIASSRSMVSARTINTVDILKINTLVFYKILSTYPQILKNLEHNLVNNISYIQSDIPLNEFTTTVTEKKLKEQRSQLTKLEKFRMSKIMDGLLMLSSFASYIIITYEAAFIDVNGSVITISLIFDVFHILKIYAQFNTPYISSLGEIITSRKLIKNRYIRTANFYIDLFGLVPIELIPIAFSLKPPMYYVVTLRLNRIVRLYNVHNFFKVNYDYLNVHVLFIKLCSIAVFATIFIHTVACTLYAMACPYNICSTNSWHFDKESNRSKCAYRYSCSLYYTMSMVSFSGYTLLLPTSYLDIIVSIITVIISKFVVSIFISDMAAVVRYYGFKLSSFAEEVDILKVYLNNGKISYMLQVRVLKYVDELWHKWSGHQIPFFLKRGPAYLKEEIMMYSFGIHIYNNVIFYGCHTDMLRQVVSKTRVKTFFIGDCIVRQGDIDNSMYFIHKGKVDVVLVGEKEELIVDMLETYDCFGLVQGLYPNTPHTHTYQSKALTEMVILFMEDWVNILQFFPASKYMIYYMMKTLRNNNLYDK